MLANVKSCALVVLLDGVMVDAAEDSRSGLQEVVVRNNQKTGCWNKIMGAAQR